MNAQGIQFSQVLSVLFAIPLDTASICNSCSNCKIQSLILFVRDITAGCL